MPGGKRHEVIIPAGISSGVGSNGAKSTGLGVVGSTVVDLDVSPKFKGHGAVVRFRATSDNGGGR